MIILCFLVNCVAFNVRLSTALSEAFLQESGVPQGGVLSSTISSIALNPICTCIPTDVSYCKHAHDLFI